MTSRRRVDYVRVLQALLDALPQPPAVQTVVSDFEAALSSAVRDVFPGVAQRGREFHFSQAAGRVEERPVGRPAVGVYAKDDVMNRPHLPQDTDTIVSCRQMSLAMSSVNLNRWQLQEATLMCKSIYRTSAITGLTAVGDRQRGRHFASRSARTTMLKAGITV